MTKQIQDVVIGDCIATPAGARRVVRVRRGAELVTLTSRPVGRVGAAVTHTWHDGALIRMARG